MVNEATYVMITFVIVMIVVSLIMQGLMIRYQSHGYRPDPKFTAHPEMTGHDVKKALLVFDRNVYRNQILESSFSASGEVQEEE